MDEVDNIIIHTLRQLGCHIDDDVLSLSSFTPELLVETVATCLQLVKPNMNLPKTLPAGMAQRFSVTASLAEACASVGFRGDIGYQTFLYSNVTEVRRVFMFLIERLPKESEKLSLAQPLDKLSTLENEILRKIRIQTSSPWIPQYCIKSGIRMCSASTPVLSGQCTPFQPYITLNIPNCLRKSDTPPEQHDYWLKRSPSIFQQTNSQTICPSIIHKNDIEARSDDEISQINAELVKSINTKQNQSHKMPTLQSNDDSNVTAELKTATTISNRKLTEVNSTSSHIIETNAKMKLQANCEKIGNVDQWSDAKDVLDAEIVQLKRAIDELLVNRKTILTEITNVKDLRTVQEESNRNLRNKRKISERTCILLENPDENVKKMDVVLAATKERMTKLIEQWKGHKEPLIKSLEKSKLLNSSTFRQNKLVQNEVKVVREKRAEIVDNLKNKNNLHAQLTAELQKVDNKINRTAYTTRILEIVGNIRKQKNDIDKVLRDTRELQKEINNINGQLDRQFTVTDDLLYKTARRDEHSKRTYKLLATLHSDCNDLVTLVQDTGAIMREVRDLEDQIENEKARNISINLEKITSDLKLMEKDSKDLQEKIRHVENEITQG